jgi:hypothetical protein
VKTLSGSLQAGDDGAGCVIYLLRGIVEVSIHQGQAAACCSWWWWPTKTDMLGWYGIWAKALSGFAPVR